MRPQARPFRKFAGFLGSLPFGALFFIWATVDTKTHDFKGSDAMSWVDWVLIFFGIFMVWDAFIDWMNEIDNARYAKEEK